MQGLVMITESALRGLPGRIKSHTVHKTSQETMTTVLSHNSAAPYRASTGLFTEDRCLSQQHRHCSC